MIEQAADAETDRTPELQKNAGNTVIQENNSNKEIEEGNGKGSADPQSPIGVLDNQTESSHASNAILQSLNKKVKAQASAFQFIF